MSAKRHVIPDVKDFADLSVEFLYNFLRFNAFASVSDTDKKTLFLKAIHVPLRKSEIFKQITDAVNSNDFQKMKHIVLTNTLDTNVLVSKAMGIKFVDIWPIIMEAYFVEEDPALALNLLRTLMFFKIENGELGALERFISNYKNSNQEIRSMMTSGDILNAYTI
jgi:hypothetical protein